jgi:carboxymethylenebutenolidase
MRRDIIRLYDEYTHAPLERRVFLERLAKLAGGTSAAMALLPMLENNYALAETIAADDARLVTETVSFDAPGGPMRAYVAKPADASEPLPAVVVIHENRGLTPYTQDVVRRVALEGYVAVGPDLLAPLGGTPADEDQGRTMYRELDDGAKLQNTLATVNYARGRPDSNGRIGVIGFCAGGTLTNQVAVADAEIGAAVPFYGGQPPAEDAAKIEAPLMLHYAGLDERINAGIDAYTQALDAAGVDYTMYMYEGVNHAFHNDTGGRYDAAAAELAWQRTIAFLNEHLRDQGA